MKAIISTLLLCLIATNVFALGETESMRCNNGIVSPGDNRDTVIQKCGAPDNKTAILNRRLKIGYKTYYSTEKWLYDFGTQEFNYIVLFNGDRVSILFSTNDHGTFKP